MGEEGVVSYGPNSPREIKGDEPGTVRDEEQDLRTMIHHGMDVYDGEQKKIGSVKAVSEPYDSEGHFYITVETGFLGLGHDLYIPSQYLSVWDNQVGVDVSKGHIDTMGWENPPQAAEENAPSERRADEYDTSANAPENPESAQQRQASDEQIQRNVQEHPVERGGSREQPISDVPYTEQQDPLEMNAAGETEARDEINAGQTSDQQEAYKTESEAERTEGTGPASREQWHKASEEEKVKSGSPEAEAAERARGAAGDYTKYE